MKPSPKEPTAGHTKTNDVKNLRLQLSECGKSLETCGLVSVTIAQLNPCGSLTPKEQRKVAGFIVTACNRHAELVRQLKNMVDMWDFIGPAVDHHFAPKVELTLTNARTLLTRLNEKGQR